MDDQDNDFAREGEYRSSGGNVSLGMTLLFVGLAIGAVTALLMAPKTGKQMRRTLRRKYEDARDVHGRFWRSGRRLDGQRFGVGGQGEEPGCAR